MYNLKLTKDGNYVAYNDVNGHVALYKNTENMIPGEYDPSLEEMSRAKEIKYSQDMKFSSDEEEQFFHLHNAEPIIQGNLQDHDDMLVMEMLDRVHNMLH